MRRICAGLVPRRRHVRPGGSDSSLGYRAARGLISAVMCAAGAGRRERRGGLSAVRRQPCLHGLLVDPDARPEEWRVEEIDSDGDGGCDVVIFSGPHAEQWAKEFAEQLRSQRRPN